MKQRIIGYVDLENKEFKMKIEAQLFLDDYANWLTENKENILK